MSKEIQVGDLVRFRAGTPNQIAHGNRPALVVGEKKCLPEISGVSVRKITVIMFSVTIDAYEFDLIKVRD